MPEALVDMLENCLGTPAIVTIGKSLGTFVLQSWRSTVYDTFNAGKSSLYQDLKPLLLASYIATVNALTDTTLYIYPDPPLITNMARDAAGHPLPGVSDFVVFSEDVVALDLTAVIAIPVFALGSWLLLQLLLAWSPLRVANAMEANELLKYTRQMCDVLTVQTGEDGKPRWR